MHPRWQICECTELGCNQETYQDTQTGEEKRGKAWSASSIKKHLKDISKKKTREEKEKAGEPVQQDVHQSQV
jgi:hypothetical protein